MDVTRIVTTLAVAGSVAATGGEIIGLSTAPWWLIVAWAALVAGVAAWVNDRLEVRAYRRACERADTRHERAVAREAAEMAQRMADEVTLAEAVDATVTAPVLGRTA